MTLVLAAIHATNGNGARAGTRSAAGFVSTRLCEPWDERCVASPVFSQPVRRSKRAVL